MPTPQDMLDAYLSACNAADPEARHRLLAQALTPDAVITYPSVEARGWEAISAAIAQIQEQLPGMRFVRTSVIETHHGWLRCSWSMIKADGSQYGEGEDVVEIAGDGRFSKVIGFRDPLPPLTWPLLVLKICSARLWPQTPPTPNPTIIRASPRLARLKNQN